MSRSCRTKELCWNGVNEILRDRAAAGWIRRAHAIGIRVDGPRHNDRNTGLRPAVGAAIV
jgi:hypothetical protein